MSSSLSRSKEMERQVEIIWEQKRRFASRGGRQLGWRGPSFSVLRALWIKIGERLYVKKESHFPGEMRLHRVLKVAGDACRSHAVQPQGTWWLPMSMGKGHSSRCPGLRVLPLTSCRWRWGNWKDCLLKRSNMGELPFDLKLKNGAQLLCV